METSPDPHPVIAPPLFWRVLVGANLLSLAILLLAFHNMIDVAFMPDLAPWFLIAGAVLVLPALLFTLRGKQVAGQSVPGQPDNATRLAQLNRLVVGCALAELPGLMGTLYYLFAREWVGTLLLLTATVVLLLRNRPV